MSVTSLVKKSAIEYGKQYLVGLSGPSDLAIVANGTGMKRQERIAFQVGRNGRGRRCMHLHHLFILLEDDPHDIVDEIVGQLGVRDSEIVVPPWVALGP